MAKKIIMGIMGAIIVVFFGLSAYNQFLKPKPEEKPKVDIYKNAMDKVDIEYLSYGESSNQCLLMITNNNKFQVHITGTITKKDENGVHKEDLDDTIDINVNPKQTYILETENPNNKEARVNNDAIAFDARKLKAGMVEGSNEDGKKSTKVLLQDSVEVDIDPDKKNDSGQPLITIKNNTNKKLALSGYVIFYEDEEQTKIRDLYALEFTDIPKKSEYRDYVYTGGLSSEIDGNFKIYVNICQ